jgi:multidrug efflux pump subunit AcrA (membrane-fusion protein)
VLATTKNINCGLGLLAFFMCAPACENRSNAVSGTIEVDEVHVGPRSAGRVDKIFAQEGDQLHAGQPIVQLDAAE